MHYKLSDKFPKKRAFITGAGSGLGKAMAIELAKEGWQLGLSDIVPERLDDTCSEVEGLGAKAFPFVLDVSDKEAYQKVADEFARYVGIDLLINNAGVGDGGDFMDYDLKHWDWMVSINLMGVVNGTHYFLPYLKEQGHGHIINIASAASFANLARMTAYNATKAAVLSLSETLYAELAPMGISVSVATPTFFKTNIMDKSKGGDDVTADAAIMMERSKVSAQQVAQSILKAAGSGRFQEYITFEARMVHFVQRLFPSLFRRIRVRLASDRGMLQRKYGKGQ